MKQMKALLTKDFHAFRKGLMVPVWIVGGAYVLFFLMILYAYAKGNANIKISGFPLDVLTNPEMSKAVSFAMQMGMYLSFIGIVVGIIMVSVAALLLNSDVKHKCELFHRSQPVSVWKLTASRYLMGLGGMIGLALLLGIFNLLITNLMVGIGTPLHINWWLSINGLLLSWLHLAVALLTVGSLCFVLSALFRDNAFGKGILGVAALEIVIQGMNGFYSLGIPSLAKALFRLVMSGLVRMGDSLGNMHYGVINFSNTCRPSDLHSFTLPPYFLHNLWSTLFTWDIAFKLLFCGVMFVLATCLYHRREVQF